MGRNWNAYRLNRLKRGASRTSVASVAIPEYTTKPTANPANGKVIIVRAAGGPGHIYALLQKSNDSYYYHDLGIADPV